MTHPQNLGKKLVDGTYGRLEFDYANLRGKNFGEYHLHSILNEILTSNISHSESRVDSNFAPPEIQSPQSTSGDKKKLDFVVTEHRPGSWRNAPTVREDRVLCAVEAKWAASAYCNAATILNDICRLTLVANGNPDAVCYFILAGPKRNFVELFKSPLLSPLERGASGPLPLTKEAFWDLRAEEYAAIEDPSKRSYRSYPAEGKAFQIKTTANKASALPPGMEAKLSSKLHVLPTTISARFVRPAHEITPNWKVFGWRVAAE